MKSLNNFATSLIEVEKLKMEFRKKMMILFISYIF
jgi:hypothetical protein